MPRWSEAADPSGDVPYDPLVDPLPDPRFPIRWPRPLPEFSSGAPAGQAGGIDRSVLRDAGAAPAAALRPAADRVGGAYVGSGNRAGVPRQLSMPGWLVVVGVPVLLVAAAQAILGAVSGFFVLAAACRGPLPDGWPWRVSPPVLGTAPAHRRGGRDVRAAGAGALDRVGSGACGPTRRVPARPDDGTRASMHRRHGPSPARSRRRMPSSPPTATCSHRCSGTRCCRAPIGPVLYLFARFAASLSFPFAQTAYYWLDWIPLRLAALGFALVGQFEDTMYCLEAVRAIRPAASAATEAARPPIPTCTSACCCCRLRAAHWVCA